MLFDIFNLSFRRLVSELDDLVLDSAELNNISDFEIVAFLNVLIILETSNDKIRILRELVVRKCFQAVSEHV